jgi:hypothetical protein
MKKKKSALNRALDVIESVKIEPKEKLSAKENLIQEILSEISLDHKAEGSYYECGGGITIKLKYKDNVIAETYISGSDFKRAIGE